MDQDTVVHHELKLPIRARYIRFQPVAWIGQRSMRVELYGHQKGMLITIFFNLKLKIPCETLFLELYLYILKGKLK